jgi:hypothetical protein
VDISPATGREYPNAFRIAGIRVGKDLPVGGIDRVGKAQNNKEDNGQSHRVRQSRRLRFLCGRERFFRRTHLAASWVFWRKALVFIGPYQSYKQNRSSAKTLTAASGAASANPV